MTELKPCPFCKSNKIYYSIKTSGTRQRVYHACMYCKSCHTYGPRVIKKVERNTYHWDIEKDSRLKQQAIEAWNNRGV